MVESLLIVGLTIFGGIGLTWYLMNRRVKNINEQLSDKQVVINELATYAEKIANEQESVVVKKTTKKTKPTVKKQNKKVDDKSKTKTKRKTKVN
jgi:GTPase involved in cell partitioning and DNA repair